MGIHAAVFVNILVLGLVFSIGFEGEAEGFKNKTKPLINFVTFEHN